MEVQDIARNEEIASLIASGVETQASALAMVRSAALQFAELIPRDYEANDVPAIVKHGRSLYADEFNGDHNLSAYFGDVATLSKMFRVAMLMPVVVILALTFHAERKKTEAVGAKTPPVLPLFLVVFALLAAANSMGWLPHEAVAISSDISRWCLVTSISALGVKTSLEKLAELGWKPIALMSSEALFVATYMLIIVFISRAIA